MLILCIPSDWSSILGKILLRWPRHLNRENQSFLIGDCSHLYLKLCREVAAFKQKQDMFYGKADIGLNVSMTAWHMVDWLWYDMQASPHLCNDVCKLLSCKPTKKSFCGALLQKSDALRICNCIATAGKHGNTKPISLKTSFHTMPAPTAENPHDLEEIWSITYLGQKYQAEEIFEEVERFWRSTLASLQLIDGTPLFLTDDD